MASKPREADQWPLLEAVKRLIKEKGSDQVAVLKIEDALKRDKLRVTICDTATGKEQTVKPAFWKTHCIHYSSDGHVIIYRGHKNDPRRWNLFFPRPEDEPPDHVYYVSKSDFERLWPAPESGQQTEVPERRKPGPRTTKQWRLHAAREIFRIVVEEKKPEPTAKEIADAVLKKTGFPPDEADIRKLIKQLL